MKRKLLLLLTLCLLMPAGALAKDNAPVYTLPIKGVTVLQNEAARAPGAAADAAARAALPGESPITGLPWQGDYRPMLVHINHSEGTEKVGKTTVKAFGIGKATPWGLQYADILYEELLFVGGYTRITALFSDCFAQGQPVGGVGPVRSCRIGPLLLRSEWQAGVVYAGGEGSFWLRDGIAVPTPEEDATVAQGAFMNLFSRKYEALRSRVQGVKAPANLNIDLPGLRATLDPAFASTPHPFLFADQAERGDAHAPARTVHLDWGRDESVTHFVYDAASGGYLRYCGPGLNAAKWAKYAPYAGAEARDEADRVQSAYANLIVQRVDYTLENNSKQRPIVQSVGSGNADLFIGGRYIPGTWTRPSLDAPTVFYDDQGNELRLNRGKTYIAHFPTDALCAYAAD